VLLDGLLDTLRVVVLPLEALRVAVLDDTLRVVVVALRDDADVALDLSGVVYLDGAYADPPLRRFTGPATLVLRYAG